MGNGDRIKALGLRRIDYYDRGGGRGGKKWKRWRKVRGARGEKG